MCGEEYLIVFLLKVDTTYGWNMSLNTEAGNKQCPYLRCLPCTMADKHSAVSEGDVQSQLHASMRNLCVQGNLRNQAQRKREHHLGYLDDSTVAFRNPTNARVCALKEAWGVEVTCWESVEAQTYQAGGFSPRDTQSSWRQSGTWRRQPSLGGQKGQGRHWVWVPRC